MSKGTPPVIKSINSVIEDTPAAPDSVDVTSRDALTEVLRAGAQKMLKAAIDLRWTASLPDPTAVSFGVTWSQTVPQPFQPAGWHVLSPPGADAYRHPTADASFRVSSAVFLELDDLLLSLIDHAHRVQRAECAMAGAGRTCSAPKSAVSGADR